MLTLAASIMTASESGSNSDSDALRYLFPPTYVERIIDVNPAISGATMSVAPIYTSGDSSTDYSGKLSQFLLVNKENEFLITPVDISVQKKAKNTHFIWHLRAKIKWVQPSLPSYIDIE